MTTNKTKGQVLTTEGLIIREFNSVGEADRFVTVLTKDMGVIRAAARGARHIKSRSGSATGLLMFSRLKLFQGRDTYIIEDAKPLETFFELRESIEKTALAQYFCELAGALCPMDEPADEALTVLLHALHHLSKNTRPLPLLKAVVEWRLLSLAGYMPALQSCTTCCNTENAYLFSTIEGGLYCADHAPTGAVPLSTGTLTALRHVLSCTPEKCFGFALKEPSLSQFGDVAEMFVKAQLNRSFKTLEFYHTIG